MTRPLTRPLLISQLDAIIANPNEQRQRRKRFVHDQIRKGVAELNHLLLLYWPPPSGAYVQIEEDFNYRGIIFLEIIKRFEVIDPATGWKLEIRWNLLKLASGFRQLEFRINKNP